MNSNTVNYSLETKLRTDSYLYLFAFTFLYYDHFLTLDAEVKFVWARPRSFSSRLFLLNRYFAFVGNIVILLSMFVAPSGASSCHPWEEFQQFFHAFVQVIVAILLTLRVHALYGRDIRVAIGLGGIIIFGIGATVASLAFSQSTPAPSLFPIGCHDVLDLKNATLVSVGWEAVLVYDTLLFSMTLFKSYQARLQPKIKEMERLSLFTIIIRDGTMYFGFMALANLVNVLTFYVSGDSLLRGTLSPFASSTSVTLMSRLMLHLLEIADKGIYICHGDTLARPAQSYNPNDAISTLNFNNEDSQETIDHSQAITVTSTLDGPSATVGV